MSAERAPKPAAADAPKPASQAELFDADIAGRMLDLRLLGRLLGWLAPERDRYLLSGALVLVQAVASVMLPVLLSIVVIDHVLMGNSRVFHTLTISSPFCRRSVWPAISLEVLPRGR